MLKKCIAPVVLSGALFACLAIGGTAYAGTPTATTAVSAPARTHQHALRTWLKVNGKGLRKAAVTVSATTIGITPQALVAELKTGMSIAQVAVEHHSTAQAVIDALTVAADARVAQAVTAGTLTQPQGAKIDAVLSTRLVKMVNRVR